MARAKYTVEVVNYSDPPDGNRKVYIEATNLSDVTTVDPKWETGSTLWDITAGKLYKLNDSGVWVEQ